MRRVIAAVMTLCLLSCPLDAAECTKATLRPRRTAVLTEFKKITGYPNGRPGFRIDHISPLCACGDDAVYNLQWQTLAASLEKDRFERQMCAALRRANARVKKATRGTPLPTMPREVR